MWTDLRAESYHQPWLRPPWQSQPTILVSLALEPPKESRQLPVASFFRGLNLSSQAPACSTGVPVLAGSAQEASRRPESYSWVRQDAKEPWPR